MEKPMENCEVIHKIGIFFPPKLRMFRAVANASKLTPTPGQLK